MLHPSKEDRAARHVVIARTLAGEPSYVEQAVDTLALLYSDVLEAENLDVRSNSPFNTNGEYIGLDENYVEDGSVVVVE